MSVLVRSCLLGLLGLLGPAASALSALPALTGKCSELEQTNQTNQTASAHRAARPSQGRPLSPAAGSTQEPSGESQSRAPVLFSGPQMAGTHLATARSSQLAACSSWGGHPARGTPCTPVTRKPTEAHSLSPAAPAPAQASNQASSRAGAGAGAGARHPYPGVRARVCVARPGGAFRGYIHRCSTEYLYHIHPTTSQFHYIPTYQPTQPLPPAQELSEADEADTSGQSPVTSYQSASAPGRCVHTAGHGRAQFPGNWSLTIILVLAFALSSLVLLLTLTAVHTLPLSIVLRPPSSAQSCNRLQELHPFPAAATTP